MMTGDERITFGSAYVKGLNLASDMNEISKEIGYCPQFDALLDDLTGRETLKIFCLLRGIRKERINYISEELAKSFGLMKHLDKETRAYSGGNKRKLSTAIAVIGSPSVIYLDEPTTGMDPAAKTSVMEYDLSLYVTQENP
ncbi:ATP-binding cassette sub-family A member 3 [Eumeta japonica]|uniref:ATP-binding cassette sub-family A member 3 n=1 Tax=Eumeta variegata TaxID=151549 RepID=A0A4C1SU27_EUMVA|nr:ATP-binding cassette sub-family A member 3 [Eumeta japonica]